MSEHRFDVLGLGNAIVDVLADVDDTFLAERGLVKGSMGLVDEDAARDLHDRIRARMECSGGSAANTMVGIASLGGRAAFVGRVHADPVGELFAADIRAAGVAFDTAPAADPPATGRCLVLVSGDAERTMQTFLGAAAKLSIEDVHAAREWIRGARVTYLEGYLFDPPPAQAAFRAAAALAHDAGREVALSLSDAFCVDRHREAFRELVRDHVDLLFANEVEILSLYGCDTFDEAAYAVGEECRTAVLTRGANGAAVVTAQGRIDVPAERVERVVDTTGAGDLFAAGYLYGHTRDLGPA
jgi:sugar/nucleoside kinase (ribokinase family)